MRIGKRISFSLDGVSANWGCCGHARKRINVDSGDWLFLYLNPHARVNTILTHSCDCARHARSDVVRPLHSALRQRARAGVRSRSGSIPQHLSPIAKILAPAERFYGLGAGVGRGLGVCAGLGVGVGVGDPPPTAANISIRPQP